MLGGLAWIAIGEQVIEMSAAPLFLPSNTCIHAISIAGSLPRHIFTETNYLMWSCFLEGTDTSWIDPGVLEFGWNDNFKTMHRKQVEATI